jgi:hypothetical protein
MELRHQITATRGDGDARRETNKNNEAAAMVDSLLNNYAPMYGQRSRSSDSSSSAPNTESEGNISS